MPDILSRYPMRAAEGIRHTETPEWMFEDTLVILTAPSEEQVDPIARLDFRRQLWAERVLPIVEDNASGSVERFEPSANIPVDNHVNLEWTWSHVRDVDTEKWPEGTLSNPMNYRATGAHSYASLRENVPIDVPPKRDSRDQDRKHAHENWQIVLHSTLADAQDVRRQ